MQPSHQDPHDAPLLSLIAPFYNEGEALCLSFARVVPILGSIDGTQLEIVCVNGGSANDTLPKFVAVPHADPRVRVADPTRSLGKEAVLTIGLNEAPGDIVIPIDADL